MKFEYMLVHASYRPASEVLAELNERGAEGWRVVPNLHQLTKGALVDQLLLERELPPAKQPKQ
jgi:hypothetical protein